MVKILVICAFSISCLAIVDGVFNLVTNGQVSLTNILVPQFPRLDGDPIAFLLSRIIRLGLCFRMARRNAIYDLVLCCHLIRSGRAS